MSRRRKRNYQRNYPCWEYRVVQIKRRRGWFAHLPSMRRLRAAYRRGQEARVLMDPCTRLRLFGEYLRRRRDGVGLYDAILRVARRNCISPNAMKHVVLAERDKERE